MRYTYLILATFLAVTIAHGQIPMQSWRVHFSAFNAVGVANDQNSVYMAASNGIVQFHLDDNSLEMLTMASGLSDLGISCISDNDSLVIIGYSNGNLDILKNNRITNVPWIKKSEIAGNKSVHSIYFYEDLVYISTGIGLVLYDPLKNEIRDTYYPYANPFVYSTCIYHDTLFCATAAGIYFAPKNQPFLNDQSNWTKKTDLPASVLNGPFTEICSFQEKLVFAYNSASFGEDTVYFIQNGSLNKYNSPNLTLMDMNTDADELVLTLFSSIQVLDSDLQQLDVIYQYVSGIPEPKSCMRHDGFLWAADNNHGLVRIQNNWTNDVLFDSSPYKDACYRLDIQYGKVLVAGGGLTHNLVNNYFRNGVYLFDNEQWTNFNFETQDSIYYDKDWDFVSVAINPNNTDQMAFGSASEGGLKLILNGTDITEIFNSSNSTLESTGSKITIGDMKYDEQGNLWIVNTGIEPLKMMTPNGDWYSFSLGSSAKDKYPYRLMIDQDGNKWVALNNAGLVVFNEHGTFSDVSDDELRTFTTSEGYGHLPSLFVKAIAQDLDGEIWIGTEEGMVVLYSTTHIYDGSYGEFDFNPILKQVDGEVEKLLGESYITSITVDGGNRKWVGTSSSGVFCLSPDGMEEIYRFTTENSPLVSNNVLDIRVDHLSGEVFFATDKGLVSFRADASIFDEEFSDVKVFPNPVTPEFSGPITIQGLGYDSDVKFTDVSGNVIYTTRSNGGTVIWDGKTLQGDRVPSGVYLVWTASSEGKGRNVAKILFIN